MALTLPRFNRFSLALITAVLLCSNSFSNSLSLYEKLCEVNAEWKKQTDFNPILHHLPALENEQAMIVQHLSLVEEILRSRDVAHLAVEQQQERLANLDRLHAYWLAGAFPINDRYNNRLPIFIDAQDNFCAVGHLMKTSGNEDLSRSISDQFNLNYLAEMSGDALVDWANNSGFSLEELAWIQPGYPPNSHIEPLGGGANGVVYDIVRNSANEDVFIGGAFSAVGEATNCNNVAVYTNGFAGPFWMNLGAGVNGTVYTMTLFDGDLYVGGSFSEAGGVAASNVARWDGASWVSIPGLNGEVRSLVVHDGQVYAGGSFTGLSGGNSYSNIALLSASAWVSVGASTNGTVYAMESVNIDLYVGGDFTMAGAASASNVAIFSGGDFQNLDNGVAHPVYALEWHKDKIFAGGEFGSAQDIFGLAWFDATNGLWELPTAAIFGTSNDVDEYRIYDLLSRGDNLEIAGEIAVPGIVFIFGKNLARFHDETQEFSSQLVDFDQPSRTLESFGTENMLMGGEFEIANVLQFDHPYEVPFIAWTNFGPFTSVDPIVDAANRFKLYPNPTGENVTVELDPTAVKTIRITDLLGRMQREIAVDGWSTQPISLEGMSAGTYLVEVASLNGGSTTQKLIVQ